MHLDEALQEIGVGVLQRFAVVCCSGILLSEGFLMAGIYFMVPQTACDEHLPWIQLIYLYLPLLFGMTLGSLWLGGVSDVSGRRYTLGVSCVMCFVACIVASSSTLLLVFEISTVVVGMGLGGMDAGCRLLIFETLPMNNRGSYMVILDLLSGIGTLLGVGWGHLLVTEQPSAGNFLPLRSWRLLFFVGGIFCMMGACLINLAPFSPRQMLAHQRIVSVTILLRRFYAVNKGEHESTYPNYLLEPFLHVEGRNYIRNQCSDYMVFLCRCILSYLWKTIVWPYTVLTSNLVLLHICLFDGMILLNCLVSERLRMGHGCFLPPGRAVNSENFEAVCAKTASPMYMYNIYLAVAAIIPPVLLPFVIDKCPRNAILGVSCFLTATCSFVLAYEHSIMWEIITGVLMVVFHTTAIVSLNIITLESFPTKFRSTSYGIFKFASRLSLIGLAFVTNWPCVRLFYYLTFPFLGAAVFALLLRNMNQKFIVE